MAARSGGETLKVADAALEQRGGIASSPREFDSNFPEKVSRQQRGAHSAFRVAASGAMASIPRIGEDDAYDENDGLHPVWLASNYLRRRKYDECIAICTDILAKNPYDQAVWYLKCRALTLKNWIDDTEIEEEGVAELLLDDNAIAQCPRPGTSLNRPMTSVRAPPDPYGPSRRSMQGAAFELGISKDGRIEERWDRAAF